MEIYVVLFVNNMYASVECVTQTDHLLCDQLCVCARRISIKYVHFACFHHYLFGHEFGSDRFQFILTEFNFVFCNAVATQPLSTFHSCMKIENIYLIEPQPICTIGRVLRAYLFFFSIQKFNFRKLHS